MNPVKRWTVGIFSRLDEVVSRVENHEAVAQETLREMRRGLSRASAELGRVKRDTLALRADERKAALESSQWRQRAKTTQEQERALECVRRARLCDAKARELGERARLQESTQGALERQVRSLEERYETMRGRTRILSTREAASRAASAVSEEGASRSDVEGVFERWEMRLSESEYVPGSGLGDCDELAEEFSAQEERAELERELNELRQQSTEEQ